jgi:hypothetical protein
MDKPSTKPTAEQLLRFAEWLAEGDYAICHWNGVAFVGYAARPLIDRYCEEVNT